MDATAPAPRGRIAMVVDPSDRGGRFFDCRPEAGNRDLQREPFRDLRDALASGGWELATLDRRSELDGAALVLFHARDRAVLGECFRRGIAHRTAYLAWEPPVVQPLHEPDGLRRLARWFGRILTWNPALAEEDPFVRMRYAHALAPAEPSPLPFSARGLLVNISADKTSPHPLELYSAREQVVSHFETRDPGFELWGPGWDARRHPSWRGLAPDKRSVYHRFRFALCFENMRDTAGYSTEKLFDALQWGIVPVYLGDPDLAAALPSEAFVDHRRLGSPEALRDHLLAWTPERHEAALAAGRTFLASAAARAWSGAALAASVARCAELAGIRPHRPRPGWADGGAILAAWCRARILRRDLPC